MSFSPWPILAAWTTSLTVVGLSLAFGWLAKALLFRRLRRLADRTATRIDEALLEVLERYWLALLTVAALVPAVRVSPLPPDARALIGRLLIGALLVLSTLVAARIVGASFAASALPQALPRRPSVLQRVVQMAVVIAGALLVLDNAGIEIKTLLTALGIGSLAVALALQPTLSNLFAGIHLSLAKPIRVGDFIELEDGTQGHVVDIGWRATRLRQLANNLVVVPNGRLADMRIVNYALPDPPQAVVVRLGVAYGSDLGEVERVVLEVARSIQGELEAADPEHDPFVRFDSFGESSIDCNVILRARTYTDRWLLIHALIVRVASRFAAAGIEIPFPQRVVHLARQGGAADAGERGGESADPAPLAASTTP